MGIQTELSDDMVDRVGRAIRCKLFGYVETLDVAIAAAIHSAARAAIEVMREPTHAMLASGVSGIYCYDPGWTVGTDAANEVWRAMIDEALKNRSDESST